MNNRLPLWFRQEIPDETTLKKMQLLSELNVNTVCKEAKCPNLSYCFKNAKLTFMILGDACTRNCRFCGVRKSDNQPLSTDLEEPLRIARVVRELGLNYVVITSVTRDDLKDGGADVFAKTIELIRALNRNIKVEVLIPDFSGNLLGLKAVIDAGPCVVGHNIETVKRLYKELKPKSDYRVSLDILNKIKEMNPLLTTKSSLILGLGETEEEVISTMRDLRYAHCDILTLGQYLAPSLDHYPIKEFIGIEQFNRYKDIGTALGFKVVLSGPLVRSSYRAEEAYKEVVYV